MSESPKLQRRLFSPLLSKRVPPIPSEDERKPFPLPQASITSQLFFSWLDPILTRGYKRTLEPQDLFYITNEWKVEVFYERFMFYFKDDFKKKKEAHIDNKCSERGETRQTSSVDETEDLEDFIYPRYRFLWLLYRTFWFRYTLALVLKLISDIVSILAPLLQKLLVNFVSERAGSPDLSVGKGIGYSFGVTILIFFSGLLGEHSFYQTALVGCLAKSVLTRLILEKSFDQSEQSKHDFPPGKITSLMGGDVSRMEFACVFLTTPIVLPVPIIIAIALLIVNIGVSALVGIAVFLLVLGFISYIPRIQKSIRKDATKSTDARVGLVTEVLQNFRMIKFYSWESAYTSRISTARKREMSKIYILQVLNGCSDALSLGLPGLCSMISFFVLHAISSSRSVGSIFSSLNLFQQLSEQIIMVPTALSTATDAWVGLGRIVEFLSSGESCAASISPLEEQMVTDMKEKGSVLRVVDASFEWMTFNAKSETEDGVTISSGNSEKLAGTEICKQTITNDKTLDEPSIVGNTSFPGLNHINLEIKQGEFIVVTGTIGSGKSSLLNALAGFMPKICGQVAIVGELLLCGSNWIQNATLKDNIIFGSAYDQVKYEQVIHACSLETDLKLLPAGDLTEVGEKGITLSGGQKARISLARAVYSEKDILLFDDVLSAVDARVGKHIVEQCFMGLLKGKTKILATHQLSLISSADRVIFLNGDGSIDIDDAEGLKKRNPAFARLMEFHTSSHEHQSRGAKEETELVKVQSQLSSKKEEGGRLMQEEDRGVNAIGFDVYKRYIKLGQGKLGWSFLPILFGIVSCTAFLQVWVSTWLSFWTSDKFSKGSGYYMGLYVLFTLLSIVFLVLEFATVLYLTNNASKRLNISAIERLMTVPMSFMDTTPLGRIMNRFTKDTDVLDNQMPNRIRLFVLIAAEVVAILILCIVYLPWFALAIPVIGFFYFGCASFFQAGSREVKRIEALQRSFVFSNFTESLQGLDVIKAYHAQDRFLHRNNEALDTMNEASFVMFASNRWLSIRIQAMASLLTLVVGLLSVNRVFHLSASDVGLLMSNVMNFAAIVSFLVMVATMIQNEANSIERLEYYGFKVPQEAPHIVSEKTPHPDWPANGHIEFKDVTMCYRPGLPPVLKNINLDIKPHEKIGICGRTGAGKSSIIAALYRLVEVTDESQILIDGLDIQHMGLHHLRSRLSIIPQDPILFRGTIRSNLDPFQEYSNDELWEVLVAGGLVDRVKLAQIKPQSVDDPFLHKFHLLQNVEEEGSNFSLGERQLLALARALVRRSKILIMDEATSSVDYETDSKIQNTIASQFANCTILCIAHRLRTIVNYDKILVLDKGKVAEFDRPWTLYCDEASIFRQMCDNSGVIPEDFESRN